MIQTDPYSTAIEELTLSGAVSLGRCSFSTYYRWLQEINQRLARERADWRVDGDRPARVLTARPATDDEKEAARNGI